MRIWTELEIYEVGSMNTQGQQIVEFFERLMNNQNDIIEELNKIHKLLYHSDLEIENGQ